MADNEKPMKIQSFLFDVKNFTADEAKKWLEDHDKKSDKVDTTEEYHRFRQRNPKDFDEKSFRTIEITEGTKAIAGHLKDGKRELNGDKDRFREMPFDMPKDTTDELDTNGNPVLRNVSLTSENPVMEFDHYEILDHNQTSANLDRVKGGAAWRDGHWGEQIGNMANPRIDPNSKKLYVDVTFSQHNPNAMQIYK